MIQGSVGHAGIKICFLAAEAIVLVTKYNKTAVYLAGDKVVGSSLTGFVAMITPLEI